MQDYSQDYLLNKQVKIFQPYDGYRASTDAVMLSALVHTVKQGDKILDVGAGTGAISLCLAARFKDKKPQITGLELQPKLAELANMSAQANGFDDFLHYHICDIKEKPTLVQPCTFQHVISNPPYTDHDMPSPNPSKAAAHNHSDFTLTGWIQFCVKMLAPQGMFYMINRAEAVDEILYAIHKRLGAVKIIPLFTKESEKAKRVMIIAKKDSKTPTEILPALTIHAKDGSYTSKAMQILREGCGFFD